MSGRSGDVKRGAVKAVGSCVLSALLSIAVHGGISDALGASEPPPPQKTPVSPSSAANPPAPEIPAGATVPNDPAGSPRNPNSAPMPAPVSTDHYAGSAKNPSGRVFFHVSLLFFPGAGDRIPS